MMNVPAYVGIWVSEGMDVCELLGNPPASIVRLQSEFKADLTFTVEAINENNDIINLAGSYIVSGNGPIFDIELTQTSPSAAKSKGIFKVEGDLLTYEVAQTEPSIANVTPPTVQNGFGSTSDGQFGDQNIQIYRRQRSR